MRGDTPLREAAFCCFDVETTGLSSFSRLVEIGGRCASAWEARARRFSPGSTPGQHICRGCSPSVHAH